MAYEVTATRRRPQRLENLVGQEFVAATLKNSIENGRIAHAYLFTGPRGCGKTSTARILSKALNCECGPTATPCGKCSNCQEIARGTNTDVIEIDGASNTSVENIRQIKDEILFPPQSSRYKIYIIDEVHMLSSGAFNALLKTIEEPPSHVIFIFATTELQKVPATIKSRCQQFNFRLVPIEKVKNLLAEAAAEIGIQADDEALYWIARESTGSIRDAYTLFDQVAAFSDNHITYDKIRDKLGLVGVDRLNDIFEKCVSNDAKATLETLDSFLQNGLSIEQLISNSTDYLRSLLLIKTGITREALLGQSPERFSQKVLAAWNSVQLERAISLFLNLYRDIRYSLSPRYELELAFSRLCWLSSYASPMEVKVALEKAKNLLLSAPQGTAAGNTNPFIDGGAVPPKQTADFSFQFSSPKTTSAPAQQIFSVPQANNFSRVEPIVQDVSAPQNFTASKEVSSQSETQVPAFQNGNVGTIAGENANAGEIREIVLKDFSVSNPLLASSLFQTENWTFDGQKITVTVNSSFQKMQLSSQKLQISQRISQILGKTVEFVAIDPPKEETEQKLSPQQQFESYPPEVKVLCSAFRAQVIGVNASSVSVQNQPSEAKENDDTEETSNIPQHPEYTDEEE